MADITRRRTGELLRQLFAILLEHPEGLRGKDALTELAKRVAPTEYELGRFGSGERRYEKIVRFATVDAGKAGWLLKTKGHWTVTEAGKAALQAFPDPHDFYREAVRLFREWKATQPEGDAESGEVAEVPVEASEERDVSQTYEVAEEQAWGEIELFLAKMPPYDFQELVAALLRAMGYHVAWIAPPGKDGGVDIVAFSDPLGTKPPRIKVQVKRHQDRVAVDGLRSFLAVLGDDDVGIFVNTGGFTKDAESEARTQAKRHVTLIDDERLCDLWIEHYGKLEDGARRRMPLKPIWFLAPVE